MNTGVHLLVPIKPLSQAKSRLRGAADAGQGHPGPHAELVRAIALDTVLTAAHCPEVAAVVVITSDPELADVFTAEGIEVLADVPQSGLNPALCHGDRVIRDRAPTSRVGAMHADLPALRGEDLAAAIGAAGAGRAFCADRHRVGTTLLLAAPGSPLAPLFGPRSARAHRESGAVELRGRWDSLRCDVDTPADLDAARRLGLGARTRDRLLTPGAAYCAE